ncbi:membrane hypothetical protein [uncultured Gammaproteobacteria bacterium]
MPKSETPMVDHVHGNGPKPRFAYPRIAALGLALALTLTTVGPASAATSVADELASITNLFGGIFPHIGSLTLTTEELKGVGCMATSIGIGGLAVLFGGTAILVAGSPGVSTPVVALPVLAATMWAGCAFGSTAAPGAAWLARNWAALFPQLPSP